MAKQDYKPFSGQDDSGKTTNQSKGVNYSMANKEQKKQIMFVLNQIGVPPHIKGYHYLASAIELAVNEPPAMEKVTKQLYPTIAEEFETTPSRVERAIRHAIEIAIYDPDKKAIQTINSMFNTNYPLTLPKLTNSEFMAIIANDLRINGEGAAPDEESEEDTQSIAQ